MRSVHSKGVQSFYGSMSHLIVGQSCDINNLVAQLCERHGHISFAATELSLFEAERIGVGSGFREAYQHFAEAHYFILFHHH